MKYGILTYHNIPNIGAILQAQALCGYIKSIGYDCEIIDYVCDNIVNRELVFHPSPSFLKNILLKYSWQKNKRKIERCRTYVNQLGVLSSKKYTRQTVKEANNVYDVFISGSDMIWNLDVNGHDFSFFLDFVDSDKVRLSFASSIGGSWNVDEKSQVYPFLRKYKSISVREEDTNEMLIEMGILSHHLIDPTFLIDPTEWKTYAKNPSFQNYVLVYFPTKELLIKAKQYAKANSLRVVVISQGIPTWGVTKISPYDPAEWIGLFNSASAVFTNSFHGLLFSLFFEKSVWTANYGNRITSVLNSLHLTKCRLDFDKDMTNHIDFSVCTPIIMDMRKEARAYIKRILEDTENI